MNARQRVGEAGVDPQVAAEIDRGELGEIDPVVQDRPQHPVGEAVVIFLVVGRRQIDRDKAALAALDDLGLLARALVAASRRSSRTTALRGASARH